MNLEWISWEDLLQRWEVLAKDYDSREAEKINLGFQRGSIVDAPCPGVEWAVGGGYAVRVPVHGLTPRQLVEFGIFADDIPGSWSGDPEIAEYKENGVSFLEVRIFPD